METPRRTVHKPHQWLVHRNPDQFQFHLPQTGRPATRLPKPRGRTASTESEGRLTQFARPLRLSQVPSPASLQRWREHSLAHLAGHARRGQSTPGRSSGRCIGVCALIRDSTGGSMMPHTGGHTAISPLQSKYPQFRSGVVISKMCLPDHLHTHHRRPCHIPAVSKQSAAVVHRPVHLLAEFVRHHHVGGSRGH